MKKNNFVPNLVFFLFSISLLIGFYFNEDSSGSGGFIADFSNTWGYVEALKENILIRPSNWTVHTPLHYILISKLSILFENKTFLRLTFCLISISMPILFYECLKIKYPTVSNKLLLIFASSILLLPSFRSAAIWANNHMTALIFFLLTTLFYLKWKKKLNNGTNDFKLVFFQTIFLALAVYTRQYYALFFFYFLFIYFEKLNIKNFLIISVFISFLTIPGFFLIYLDPALIKTSFDTNFSNTILVSSSIISFYMLPFLICFFLEDKENKLFNYNNIKILIGSIVTISIFYLFFDYDPKTGGGFFMKLSYILFKSPYFFLITSLIGLFSFLLLFFENKKNLILLIIFLIGFPSYMIFQKYFEPLLIFVLFLIFNTKITSIFFEKIRYLLIYYTYLIAYLLSAVLNDYLKITKTFF